MLDRYYGQEPLTGTKVNLIPFKKEHISARYIGWLNDPEVNAFLEARFVHQTYETVLAFLHSFHDDVERYMWGIYANGSEMIGTATLHTIDRNHGSGHTGLLIGERAYWGTGASTEATEMMAQFAFETLGLRRLSAGTYATNYGMNFTLKRLGFTYEGRLRKALEVGTNVYVDKYVWGILADEWRARNTKEQMHGGYHDIG